MFTTSDVHLEKISVDVWLDGIALIPAETLAGAIQFHDIVAALFRTDFTDMPLDERQSIHLQLLMKGSQFNEIHGKKMVDLTLHGDILVHLNLESSHISNDTSSESHFRPMSCHQRAGS